MLTTSALGKLTNFRDIGGHVTRSGRSVRPGIVFRCGSMHLWTAEEARTVRRGLAPRTLIDLRHEVEATTFPVPVDVLGARYVNVAFTRRTSDDEPPPVLPSLEDTYVAISELCRPQVATLIETLGDSENLPAIVFCAAGKDRTGVATAMVLGALGVDDEQIVGDYARSGVIDPGSLGDLYAEHMAALPASYCGSEPETMRRFLAALNRKHGSVRAFLTRCGLHTESFDRLERALLMPDGVGQPTRPVT